jgi:hypothetical protein
LLFEHEARLIASAKKKSVAVVFILFLFYVDDAKKHQGGTAKQIKVDEREEVGTEQGSWAVGQLDSWTVGQLDSWAVGQSGNRAKVKPEGLKRE